MVLKKSNSALNSGATQHVTNGCFLKTDYLIFEKRENQIGFGCKLAKSGAEADVKLCLRMIQAYLDWPVPDFHSINSANGRFFGRYRTGCTFSLEKASGWDLSNRIKTMMGDIDFLLDIPNTVDINYEEEYEFSTTRGAPRKRTKTASDVLRDHKKSLVDEETSEGLKQQAKCRRRHTCNARGVQRLWKHSKKESVDDNNWAESAGLEEKRDSVVYIDIRGYHHIDARASYKTISYHEPRYKSLNKRKSYVNGQNSNRRNCIETEIQDAMDICYKCGFDGPPVNCGASDDFEEEECFENQSVLTKVYNLEDFFMTQNVVKRRSKKAVNRTYKSNNNDLNEFVDNFCDKIRHPKGSFIRTTRCIDSAESTWEFIDISDAKETRLNSLSESDKGYESLGSGDGSDIAEDTQERLMNENKKAHQETPSYEHFIEKDVQTFKKSFIKMDARIPGNGVTLFPYAQEDLCLEGIPNVQTGASIPSCFSISVEDMDDSYIVGKRASIDGQKWCLSLQGKSLPATCKNLENKLLEFGGSGKERSLVDVINVSRTVLEDMVVSKDETMNGSRLSASLLNTDKTTDTRDIWKDLMNDSDKRVSAHTSTEAAVIVQKINTGDDNVESRDDKAQEPNIADTTTDENECGVCLSPCKLYENDVVMLLACRHVHCAECWVAHIYECFKRGVTQIQCMAFGCKAVMDDVTLKSLIPYDQVAALKKREQDHMVERSPHSAWCPSPQCGLVAVSSKHPLHEQFGRPVMCACSHVWCGGCQTEPHWPASCDQMAAFRTLLKKTKPGTVVVGTTQLCVELKKCPNCRYPIEKNQGCPSMVCRMCWYNFCWNCLKGTENHNVYTCTASPESNFTTYTLKNKLVYDLPIKYFLENLKVYRSVSKLREDEAWVKKFLRTIRLKCYCLPTKLLCFSSYTDLIELITLTVNDTFSFLHKTLNLMATFYVLLNFAHLNKTKGVASLVQYVEELIERLGFITDRVTTHVIGQSVAHICSKEKLVRALLKTGNATLSRIFAVAPLLQKVSKDIETAWVTEIDPNAHVRYM